MSKKRINFLVILISAIALIVALASKQNAKEAFAAIAGIVVSGASVGITKWIFAKGIAPRSAILYFTALLLSAVLGFFTYSLLAPWLSPWPLKLLLSIFASITLVLLWLGAAKLARVKILPW